MAVLPFTQWTKPKTALEALERSLEYARDEKHWITGTWIVLPDEVRDEYDDKVNKEKLYACTNIRACAAGILLMVCLNGEGVMGIKGGNKSPVWLLTGDPIGWPAIRLLAATASGLSVERIINQVTAVQIVTDLNDNGSHESVVGLFERTVERAKRT